MKDVTYLALAYGVIWFGLFAYLFRLAGREKRLRREVSLLLEALRAGSLDPPVETPVAPNARVEAGPVAASTSTPE